MNLTKLNQLFQCGRKHKKALNYEIKENSEKAKKFEGLDVKIFRIKLRQISIQFLQMLIYRLNLEKRFFSWLQVVGAKPLCCA